MSKNRLMRAGSILAVAAVISTSAVSGTFAKYVTEGKSEGTARVAKWGVKVSAESDAFKKTYTTKDTIDGITNSVEATVEVVAPGTEGTLAAASITGTPEVAVNVSYGPTVTDGKILDLGDNWVYNDGTSDTYYCPLRITVGTTEYFGMTYTSAADFETAVNDAIKAYSKNYKANTNLADQGDDSINISWKWDFETTETTETKKQTDVKDTYLGDLAANADTNDDPTIKLNLKTTVTQID